MKIFLSIFLFLIRLPGYAHLNYIHLDKVDPTGQYARQIAFLIDDHHYVDHWEGKWNQAFPKDSLIRELRRCYVIFSDVHTDELETTLLLGEIGHYLYNLEVEEYFEKAESAFLRAISLAANDYRGYWFLAHHYALSQIQLKSVAFFEKAQNLLPANEPADFWEEYCFGMMLAKMPAHCELALDKARTILGKPGQSEMLFGKSIIAQLVQPDPDSNYNVHDLWAADKKGRNSSYTSRALGFKLSIDSSWGIQFHDFTNHRSLVMIQPAILASKSGKKIGTSIAIAIKIADKDESLQGFIAKMLDSQSQTAPTIIHTPYKNIVSYETRDPSIYADWGGEHSHLIGIEQTDPTYPGLALEEPTSIPEGKNGKNGKINYFRPAAQLTRFAGRIFYIVILDTCEDIHDKSFALFNNFLQTQSVFE